MFFNEEDESTAGMTPLDARVFNEAQDLGLVDGKGEVINEARKPGNYRTEVKKVKVTKDQKIARLAQRTSMLMGKEKNDPDYKKWKEAREKAEMYRKRLEKKFYTKAKNKARAIASGKISIDKTDADIPVSSIAS